MHKHELAPAIKRMAEAFPLSSADVAEASGYRPPTVRRLGPEAEKAGVAVKLGTTWRWAETALDWISARPRKGRSGRKPKKG